MPWFATVIGIVTARSGAAESVTVTTTWCSETSVVAASSLSATVYDAAPNCTVSAGSSSSVIETVVSDACPLVAVMPPGRVPKESFTDSPSSSSVSCVALNVIVLVVSAAPNVTEAGTA